MTTELDFNNDIQVPVLALQLMAKSHEDASWTTNALLEGLQRSLDECKAELMLVRDSIHELCSMVAVPNPTVIMKAMYPRYEDIQEAVELMRREREATQ